MKTKTKQNKHKESICLNDQTVGNLKRYLNQYPDNAKVVISSMDKKGNYIDYDCQIACNFEHQQKENVVQFIPGMPT